jgi:ABC-2 type transport system ATP-binding protein
VQAFIRTLRERHDSTILLCTHDMAEAEALADRVGILHQGTLLCLAPPAEIRARYGAATLEQAFLNATGVSFEDEAAEQEAG